MAVDFTLLSCAFFAKAKQLPTLANPYMAHIVINALNPAFANNDVSTIVSV